MMGNHIWNRARMLVLAVGTLLTASEGSYAQGNLSNRGKEFWVGYGHHQFMEPGQNNSQEMVLYFSAEQTANVTVTVQGRTAQQVTNYTVPAGSVIPSNYMPKAGSLDCRLYDVPPTFGGNGGEGIFNVSIHIESNVPIVAYAHTFGSASSGATMLMPVETYGYGYISVNSRQNYASNCFSWAYVIATHDNTVVEVIPSVQTRLNRPAGVPFTVNLNKGQIYQIIGANPSGGASSLEVSGTKFKSIANAQGDCYPIAAFSGSSRTSNPISCGSGGGDNDNQQLFPIQAWGKKYLTAPTSRSGAANTFMTNSYRVLVKDPTTVVKRNGTVLNPATLQQNSFYFFESTTADVIEADKPVMVAQFMTGGACLGNGLGDPEMIYISPVEQGIKRVGFYRNTREAIQINYLTLIIPTPGVSSLRIDGSAAFDHSYVHPQDNRYTIVVKRWTAAQSQAIVTSDSAFTAITYGLGSVESYGYNAGTLINNLSALSQIQNTPDPTTPVHLFTCQGTPVKLSVLMAYQPTKLDILLSTLGGNITPNADVIMNNPVLTGTTSVNGVPYYQYELPGTYVFNGVDTFIIPVKAYHPTIENCYNREDLSIAIIVKAKPKADFSYTHTGCTLDPVNLSGTSPTANGYVVQSFNWTFPGGATATGQNQVRNLSPGVNDVRLRVVTADGCASDTLKQITVYDRPPAEFKVTPNQLCVGTPFTITDTSSASIAVNTWYWDFGNGVTQTVTTGPTVTYTYPTAGTYTIKHVTKSSATCISDTIRRTVTVYHKPTVNFTNDASGCLSPAGLVQFTGTASTPDAQAIASHSWIFGDPNASGSNPNTSTLQNPTHNYQQGTFTVKYWATTANGCVDTSTQTLTFNLKPAITYPALNAVCENAPAFSIATANVTNGVTGTGVYSGPGTTAAGQFNPALAGYGTHTIKYVFTSGAGCSDSVTRTIVVYARPRTSFTIPAPGCLPTNGLVAFTNTTNVPDGQATTWLWNFGDPNANGSNPNTSTLQNPTHNFGEGTYSIKLEATTANGCFKDTTIQAIFKVKPALSYAALNAVCENAPAFSVATAAVTNGVTGTGVYSGPGTSTAGQFNPALAGYGTHTIKYVFTSAGGCADSITQTILVHARPRTNFTIPAGGCLPIGGLVTFTNTTNIPDGQAATWLWNFGDPNANGSNPNTSTLQNPSHNYGDGTYSIKLEATTANGCFKDTTIQATFKVKPSLSYAALNAVCENAPAFSVASASVTNGVTGTGVYSGPGTTAAGQFNPAVAGYGTHTIKYVFTSAGGCADSITQTILVRARPRTNFTLPAAGCLPTSGLVAFTNATNIPDGQSATWLWNFGDPNANGSNPNTSTLLNPTHNYGEGTYSIKLEATTANGCFKDTTIQATFKVTPALSYAALSPVCENIAAFSIANATVTNGVTGAGVYSGPGTTAAGQFDPSVAGPGTHTITYTHTSAGGCAATITSTIQVYPRPTSSFTISANGSVCLGEPVTIASTATVSSGSITTWNWNLGNGQTPSNPNGNPFSVNYTPAGSYTVQLTTTSNNGCISLPTTRSVTINALPVADFALPTTPVCMPGGATNFTNQSTLAGGGNLNYQWSFGDGNTSTQTNPSNAYNAIGSYSVTLIATSAAGCADTVTKPMSNFVRKPVASFQVSPSEICQGANNQFTDQSNPFTSTIQNWNWSFGDGTTATAANPLKKYSLPGNYNVSLTVTNAAGCISDPFVLPVIVHLQPVIDAGINYVLQQGTQVTLAATANSPTLTFQWSPAIGLSNAAVLNPVLTALQDQVYTLTAIGDFGCRATDQFTLKILKLVTVPNVFSPNGDGIHDSWKIPNLSDYPGSTVEVFNRYGQQVFYSLGYNSPWNGTLNGKPLPDGTYYYIIQLKNGFKPLNGSVTILR